MPESLWPNDHLDFGRSNVLCLFLQEVTMSEFPTAPPAAHADAEIDAVLAEFNGDARAAIRALLHDLSALARDADASTSWGYVRGRVIRLRVVAHAPQG
jgi:hypothetical protein